MELKTEGFGRWSDTARRASAQVQWRPPQGQNCLEKDTARHLLAACQTPAQWHGRSVTEALEATCAAFSRSRIMKR